MTYDGERMPPTGSVRVVGIDDLFFSTTDRKGIITGANSVFSNLSRFPRSELLGAPHNIIRHPDMPGGAFQIMWDLLLAGKPMAAYVKNLAKDGAAYWVFATITPLNDGFLSVRIAPTVTSLWHTVDELYTSVTPLEVEARNGGMSRNEAAQIGLRALAAGVTGLGFASYEEFLRYAMPLEVASRAQASTKDLSPRGSGDLGQLVNRSLSIREALNVLMTRLTDLQQLADGLGAAASASRETMVALDQATLAASRSSQIVATTAPTLTRTAEAMSDRSSRINATLTALATSLQAVRDWVVELRFRIALASLHCDMVLHFAIEVDDGLAPPEGVTYVPPLCQALAEGVQAVAHDMGSAKAQLDAASTSIVEAGQQLRDFQKLLATWRILVPRSGASRELSGHVGPIDSQLASTYGQVGELLDLAQRCSREATPFDPGPLTSALAHIARSAQAIDAS